jgi:hypothetical protein
MTQTTQYKEGQSIAICYFEGGKTQTRAFKITKVEEIAVDGVEMLVDGIHKALGTPLPESVKRDTEIWCVAADGSKHRFIIKFYSHALYVAGKWVWVS